METKVRVNGKKAVEHARQAFASVFPDASKRDAEVEAIEPSDDGRSWFVTLSYLKADVEPGRKKTPAGPLAEVLGTLRKVRTFVIDAETGEFVAMRSPE